MSSSDPASPAIRLEGVHLSLTSAAGPVPVLRGIDLVVERGETVGLVGPSGSGKTSLLMVIAGLERATAGTVWAAGQNLGTSMKMPLLASAGIMSVSCFRTSTWCRP